MVAIIITMEALLVSSLVMGLTGWGFGRRPIYAGSSRNHVLTSIASDSFQFKVDLQLFFLCMDGLLLAIYAYLGLFSVECLMQTLYYSPCIAAGMVTGMLIFRIISNNIFKTLSVILLGCLGVGILMRELV